MHTPTKQQWQTVIDNLKKVLPIANNEESLDMSETNVCNTVNCVGGWYVIATKGYIQEGDDEGFSYRRGTKEIANILGFKNDDSLENFLSQNDDLWGNVAGGGIFSDEEAYYHPTKRPEGAQTLQHVIDHFEEVRDRSPE